MVLFGQCFDGIQRWLMGSIWKFRILLIAVWIRTTAKIVRKAWYRTTNKRCVYRDTMVIGDVNSQQGGTLWQATWHSTEATNKGVS